MKKLLIIILMIVLVSCNNEDNSNDIIDTSKDETKMTQEEIKTFDAASLSKFNGKDGMATYIAIEGIVYDVSDEPMWIEGLHQGSFQAGQDLTAQMKNAPHGFSKLDGLKEVGTYKD